MVNKPRSTLSWICLNAKYVSNQGADEPHKASGLESEPTPWTDSCNGAQTTRQQVHICIRTRCGHFCSGYSPKAIYESIFKDWLFTYVSMACCWLSKARAACRSICLILGAPEQFISSSRHTHTHTHTHPFTLSTPYIILNSLSRIHCRLPLPPIFQPLSLNFFLTL
jgi:hypothetical protein